MTRRLSHCLESLSLFMLRVGAFLVIPAIVVLVTLEVTLRYGFNAPFGWAGEVAGLMLLVVFIMAIPHCTATNRHIRVDLVYDRFGKRGRRAADAVAALVGMFVSALIAYKAGANVPDMIKYEEAGMLTGLPFWPLSALLSASGGLLLVQFAIQLAAALIGPEAAADRP